MPSVHKAYLMAKAIHVYKWFELYLKPIVSVMCYSYKNMCTVIPKTEQYFAVPLLFHNNDTKQYNYGRYL